MHHAGAGSGAQPCPRGTMRVRNLDTGDIVVRQVVTRNPSTKEPEMETTIEKVANNRKKRPPRAADPERWISKRAAAVAAPATAGAAAAARGA